MLCPNCSRENPEDARFCSSCGVVLAVSDEARPPKPPGEPEAPPRTSGMAIASLVLGLLGLLTVGVTALVGVALGIIGLIQINRRPHRLTGSELAIGGIAVSAVSLVLALVVAPILIAILFPVFARAREKAVQTSCMANLKQISVCTLMYAADYDERLPLKDSWCDAIYDRVGNEQVYVCPALPEERCGYAYNARLHGVELTSVKSPGDTVACYDAIGGWNAAGDASLADPRHNGGLNVSYVDGHVKWRPGDGLSSDLWDPLAGGGQGTGSAP
jgi:prepilin-type processing-associated H-X9-DG protein